ncbi:MAG TPA: hypothetical protein VLH60_05455 [Sedimentisphaerales bacterium]|nr:hypothetical protein [Sedimentisphaerales bacterium]
MNIPADQNADQKPQSSTLRTCLVLAAVLTGLVLAPGYLIYCGYGSGKYAASYDIICGSEDPNAPPPVTTPVMLTTDMNPVGFNIIMTTPFRDHARAREGQYRAALARHGHDLWETIYYLDNARRKEAIAGTTFTMRLKTFVIEEDGQYDFIVTRPAGMEGLQSVRLEVRRNARIPNPWVISLGILILVVVMIWAIIPPKGHDLRAERIGSKWYAD